MARGDPTLVAIVDRKCARFAHRGDSCARFDLPRQRKWAGEQGGPLAEATAELFDLQEESAAEAPLGEEEAGARILAFAAGT